MAFNQEVIQELINTYPQICGYYPTAYVIQDFDGLKVGKCLLEVCHANLKYHITGVFDELITAVPRTEPHELGYVQALIDGPFQKWKDLIELVQLTTGQYYLHIKDLNQIPSKVVYNFCIASRAPIEFPAIVSRWDDLIKGDIHPSVALCVSARELFNNKMASLLAPAHGHWWFQANHDWRTIIQGNPKKLDDCPSFSEKPYSSAPADIIWGMGDRTELKDYLKLTVDELDKKFREELNL